MPQIKRVKTEGHKKRCVLLVGKNEIEIELPRFAPVGRNDELHIRGLSRRNIWLESEDPPSGKIQVLPTFKTKVYAMIGTRRVEIRIEEITSKESMRAYESLERFHYRSSPSLIQQDHLSNKKKQGSRKAVLLASTKLGRKREYLGYIELSMPLMMVAPRHRAFSRPFKHPERNISWVEWNKEGLRKYLNLIVRISRVVIHPTFRGIGLAKKLVLASEAFAKSRWHIGQRRPLFMEISAEMLNYLDFVSPCDYHYCGHTEGNQARVAKDMRSMSKGQKITSGIMSLQKKYFAVLEQFSEQKRISIDEAISEVERIAKLENPENELIPEDWFLLKRIFRFPRPYFLKGLDRHAEKYIKEYDAGKSPLKRFERPINARAISIKNLRVTANIRLPASRNVSAIQRSFGLEGRDIDQTLLVVETFTAQPGEIYLLVGASGTGKSIFLDALGHESVSLPNNLTLHSEEFSVPTPKTLTTFISDQVIIDYFADHYGLHDALRALAIVGLSEAVPLIKPFWMLSKGQQYRVQLAELILSKSSVWLLDEFSSDLDPVTAAVTSQKLRSLAERYGIIVFVAAANHTHFIAPLKPTRVLNFDLGISPRTMTPKEYSDELFQKIG